MRRAIDIHLFIARLIVHGVKLQGAKAKNVVETFVRRIFAAIKVKADGAARTAKTEGGRDLSQRAPRPGSTGARAPWRESAASARGAPLRKALNRLRRARPTFPPLRLSNAGQAHPAPSIDPARAPSPPRQAPLAREGPALSWKPPPRRAGTLGLPSLCSWRCEWPPEERCRRPWPARWRRWPPIAASRIPNGLGSRPRSARSFHCLRASANR